MEDTYKTAAKPVAVGEAAKLDIPPHPSFVERFAVPLALLAVYIIWGSTYLAIRVTVQGGFPPFLMVGTRFLIAGGLLYTVLRLRGTPNPTWQQFRNGAIVGAFLVFGGNGIVSFAEQWVTSGFAALAVATAPLWAALFAGLWGKWPRRLEWAGIAIGFAGIVLLNVGNGIGGSLPGVIALLFAPMSWAFGSVISRRMTLPAGLMTSAAEMLGGGTLALLVSLVLGERFAHQPSLDALFAFAYLILIGSLIAYSAYDYLLHHTRLALATSYAYVNPPVAVLLGAILLGETLTLLTFIAMLVILAGTVLLAIKPKRA